MRCGSKGCAVQVQIETWAKLAKALALGELEASSGFALAVFLALDCARVASQEPALLQHATELRLVAGERNRDAMPDRAGLTRKATAAHRADDVVLAFAL